MDPWAITPLERARHAEQFASISPINGFVTGAQAKGFFMQSGLSPMILAQIWGLADINGDGQMDLNEFSIACKLINLKLKGFDIPSVLPPSILVIPQVAAPVAPIPPVASAVPTMPTMGMQQPQAMMQMPGMPMGHPMSVGMPMTSMPMTSMPMAGVSTQPTMMVQSSPIIQQPVAPQMPIPNMPHTTMVGVTAVPGTVVAAPSPAGTLEWAIPQTTQAKYSNIFQQTDKNRTGFLAGVQARNILLQSGLPQNVLAQIWALSDIDNDGRLSLEEFIVSGYMCELATKGEPLPATLPLNLIPPRYRRNNAASSDTVSTPGSAQGDGTMSPSTFEDKRRENFNKGQAELERRRQSLVDQQKKEEEERKKKEKAEAEEREKQRKELERQRLAEWEKSRKEELNAHRQREQDKLLELKAKQSNLNNDLENLREKVKTLTTNIGDSRTGVSEVKSFIDGMRTSRDTKMQDMNALKAKLKEQNERLLIVTQEKAQLETKNKVKAENGDPEMTDFDLKKIEKEKEVVKLRETLAGLKEKETEVKDKYEDIKKEMDIHREDLKKIIKTCQDMYSSFDDKRREIRAEKAKRIRELTDPDHAWGHEVEEVAAEVVAAPAEVSTAAADVSNGNTVKYRAIFDFDASNDDELSFKVGDVILSQANQVGEPGWLGGELNGKVGWFPEGYVEKVDDSTVAGDGVHENVAGTEDSAAAPVAEKAKARAIFDWTAINSNYLTITKGDVMEVVNQVEEAWWWMKKGDGQRGLVPSSHVVLSALEPRGSTPVEAPDVSGLATIDPSELYIAVYPYNSQEAGDLTFDVDDVILVTSKDSEWWNGKIDDRTGTFPYNYVEPISGAELKVETNQTAAQEEGAGLTNKIDENQAVPTTNKEPSTGTSIKKKKKKDEGKKLGIATVVAPYEASSKEQLTLTKGQMVSIRKKTDTGWWQGEIQGKKGEKRQVGWFPASYVKLLGGDKANTDASAAAAAAATNTAKESNVAFVRALFPYGGQQEDELCFEEGNVIKLISKDEPDWWRGELNGKTGVFPSNYVEIVES